MPEQPNADERVDPSAGDLPLEDPRWTPLIPEHRRLAERLGSGYLAAVSLTDAGAAGDIRYMGARLDKRGLRELLPLTLWVAFELRDSNWTTFGISQTRSLGVHPRRGGGYIPPPYVLFAWKPDLDRFWLRFELPPVTDQKLDAVAIDPPALAASPEPSPAPISKPTGPLKERIRAALALRESKPKPDDSYEDWAKRALPNDKPHSVATILSKDNVLLKGRSMWKEAGGTPAKPGRKPHA
jgi:hypothetical protein